MLPQSLTVLLDQEFNLSICIFKTVGLAMVNYQMLNLGRDAEATFFLQNFYKNVNYISYKSVFQKKYSIFIYIKACNCIIHNYQKYGQLGYPCYLLYTIHYIVISSQWIILDAIYCTLSCIIPVLWKDHWNWTKWANWSLANNLYRRSVFQFLCWRTSKPACFFQCYHICLWTWGFSYSNTSLVSGHV